MRILMWSLWLPFRLVAWLLHRLFRKSKYINAGGYVVLGATRELEHRYLAKQVVGRALSKNEVVHHINGKRADNRISNLCLMDRYKHEHFHAWLRWKKKKSGKYPKIKSQKHVLKSEYNGILLSDVS